MILNRLFEKPIPDPSIQGMGMERRDGWDVILEAKLAGNDWATGISVTPETALTMTAVFAAVSLLAETIGSLPLITYERKDKSRRKATEHYLYSLLHDAPNEMMTAVEYRSTLQGYLALRGNAISQIVYDERGRVSELWPLRWENVYETRVEKDTGRIFYYYLRPDNVFEWLNNAYIWHLRGWGSDGVIGYSPIAMARRAVGLGLAAEEFGARFFGNDARPGIVLEHPGRLGPEAQKNLKESYEKEHKGLSKSHRVSILEEGMKLHEVGIPPEDAQFLETRKFQVSEIARIFRVPPHMIGDLEKATFSNIEHQGIEFVTYSLQNWMTRWEQSIKQNLLLPNEREQYYVEHLVDSLLRGDTITRYQAYQTAILSGWMTRAEPREKENLEPIDGLDLPLVPLNMLPLGEEEQVPARSMRSLDAENRAVKAAQKRQRLAQTYRQVYQDAAGRILNAEKRDVRRAARQMLPDGIPADFEMWADDYYKRHPDTVIKKMKPVARAYGELVADAAADEVDSSTTPSAPLRDSVEKFTDSYVGGYGARHSGISQSRLKERMTQARRDGLDLLEEVEDELESWQETRTSQIATEESVRFGAAMAKMVFASLGVTVLRWVSAGETCPYCSAMDGMEISIKQNFLNAGGSLDVEGADALTSTTDLGHPPLHDGCDCVIVAG